MPERYVHRYDLPIDDNWHVFRSGAVVLAAAHRGGNPRHLEVWIEHEADDDPGATIAVRVYGTGHSVYADDAKLVRSCLAGPFVWHIYAQPGRSSSGAERSNP